MRKRFFMGLRPHGTATNLIRLALIEAMRGGGCPLCRLAAEKSRRYVDTLLNEAVTDVEQRDVWRQARGLCNWHAWMAVETPHSAGSLAILYADVLRQEIKQLDALSASLQDTNRKRQLSGHRLTARLRHWCQAWFRQPLCPSCRLWREQERLSIAVLLDDWQDAELAAAFAQGRGVCQPHLFRIVRQGAGHVYLPAFLEAQQGHLQALQDELQEFIRKLDYRFAHQPYGREADAWQRVVALFTGTRGWLGTGEPPGR